MNPTISSSATVNAFRGRTYGEGRVCFDWSEHDPLNVHVKFVSSGLGASFQARIPRTDLACAVTGIRLKTLTYGTICSGTELWIGWRDDDGVNCTMHIDKDLVLFVLDGSEGIVQTGSEEEEKIVEAAVNELAEQIAGWQM